MTEYTHLCINKKLHTVLKTLAKRDNIPMSRVLTEAVSLFNTTYPEPRVVNYKSKVGRPPKAETLSNSVLELNK